MGAARRVGDALQVERERRQRGAQRGQGASRLVAAGDAARGAQGRQRAARHVVSRQGCQRCAVAVGAARCGVAVGPRADAQVRQQRARVHAAPAKRRAGVCGFLAGAGVRQQILHVARQGGQSTTRRLAGRSGCHHHPKARAEARPRQARPRGGPTPAGAQAQLSGAPRQRSRRACWRRRTPRHGAPSCASSLACAGLLQAAAAGRACAVACAGCTSGRRPRCYLGLRVDRACSRHGVRGGAGSVRTGLGAQLQE